MAGIGTQTQCSIVRGPLSELSLLVSLTTCFDVAEFSPKYGNYIFVFTLLLDDQWELIPVTLASCYWATMLHSTE